MHNTEKAILITELRLMATAMFRQNGSTLNSKLMARAITAIIDEQHRTRKAIAAELDIFALSQAGAPQHDLIIKASRYLHFLAANQSQELFS